MTEINDEDHETLLTENNHEKQDEDTDGEELLQPSSDPPNSPHDAGWAYEVLLFYACGMGGSLCYIAALSSLVYFEGKYGADSYVYMNLAVYFPLLPVSVAQARFDQEYDKQFGSYRTFLTRGLFGFVLSVIFTAMIPLTAQLGELMVCTTLLGASGAVLQGTFNQMTSFVSDDPRLKAAVSAGLQSSALLTLIVSLLTGFGSSEKSSGLKQFFFIIASLECVLLGFFLLLMYKSHKVARAMLRRDSSIGAPLVDAPDVEMLRGAVARSMGYYELWQKTSMCCVTLILTLIPSFLVGSWFTHVKSDLVVLPQILFYTRIGSDFMGRLATVLVRPISVLCLCIMSVLRILVVLVFFINASTYWFPQRDILSILLVALISFASGYLVTGCFQLGPALLPPEQREISVAKQASLLNVAFSIAAFLGISFSIVLSILGV